MSPTTNERYKVSGNTITLTGDLGDTQYEYCVSENKLTVTPKIANPTVTGTIVLQKNVIPGSGGVAGSGGETGSGGKTATGGTVGTGGATGFGGVTGRGGATGRGGVTGSGGITGSGGSGGGPAMIDWAICCGVSPRNVRWPVTSS